jgi:DNA mismatch endonuclease, patch repair protein
MDKLTKTERSVLMSRIRSKDSKPELIVRRTVHRMGFRYRLHSNKLPGSRPRLREAQENHFCSRLFLARATLPCGTQPAWVAQRVLGR